jgi:6,7-dimethyl-8-ribityllumazine synthase
MSKDKPFQSGQGEVRGDYRYGIVAARFNGDFVEKLLQGALRCLAELGVADDNIVVVRVPGAFEIPLLCQKLAQTGRYDVLVALGCVIRGETPHFDYVCGESARGVLEVSLKFDLPVINGILTVDTEGQAEARTGGPNNKGYDAMRSALDMLDIINRPPVRVPEPR